MVDSREEALINRKSINNHDKLNLIMIILNFLLIGWWIGCFRLPSSLLELFILLIVIILTTVFHEWLHVVMFKWFGKGEARTKVLRDKKLRALMIYQSNPNVVYTKRETLWILLTPFLLITLLSLIFMMIDSIYWMVSMNMILNALGSCLDIALCLKMYRDYPKYQSVSYVYEAGEGVSMVLKTKKG